MRGCKIDDDKTMRSKLHLNTACRLFALAVITTVLVGPSVSQKDNHQRTPPPPPAHARREVVRTQNFVPRGGQAPARQAPPQRTIDTSRPPITRPIIRHPEIEPQTRAAVQRKFTKTPQGRKYDNGLTLHHGVKVSASWQRRYFPKGVYHFQHYRSAYLRGACYVSPFGFYFGVCCPYIDIAICGEYPPTVNYIDIPVYAGSNCQGWGSEQSQNLFNDPNLDQEDPGLLNAVDELTETFQNGNIDAMASLVDPNVRVAIFLRGHYRYSLTADDFLDLTRDAIQSTQNQEFVLDYLHQPAPGVFTVSGHQVYTVNGGTRTVYVSYALQDVGGQWTLTQVCTAPDRVQNLAQ